MTHTLTVASLLAAIVLGMALLVAFVIYRDHTRTRETATLTTLTQARTA